jgi:hypothetical protein
VCLECVNHGEDPLTADLWKLALQALACNDTLTQIDFRDSSNELVAPPPDRATQVQQVVSLIRNFSAFATAVSDTLTMAPRANASMSMHESLLFRFLRELAARAPALNFRKIRRSARIEQANKRRKFGH